MKIITIKGRQIWNWRKVRLWLRDYGLISLLVAGITIQLAHIAGVI